MPRYYQQTKHRKIRVYDGTATPYYLEFFHFESPTLPGAERRPDTEIELDSGRMTNNSAVYTPDETVPFRPEPFQMVVGMFADAQDLIHAFGNYFGISPWVVGGDTWTAVSAANVGTRKNSNGDNINCIVPDDSVLSSRMFNMYDWHESHPNVVGGNDWITQYLGCCATFVSIGPVGPGLIKFTVEGMIYGAMGKIAALPAGNPSTPA